MTSALPVNLGKTVKTDISICLQRIEANASHIDNSQTAPTQEFEWLAECGALKSVLPGEQLDFNKPNTTALLQLLKKVGKANLSVGRIFEGHVNALHLIHIYGSDEQKTRWYDAVRNDGAVFGVWNTQSHNGIVFEEESGNLTLKGAKTFCSGAALVSYALITGDIKTADRTGWQMAIVDMKKVDTDRIDFNSWETLGMKASGSFTVDFSGYQVTENDLLGMPGNYLTQPYFNGGAIRFAAVQLGGAEAIAEQTLTYLNGMGRTEDAFQKIRLASIMTDITTGNLWIRQAGKCFDECVAGKNKSDELIAYANMTRTVIEEIGTRIMNESNKCVGARGLMASSPLERLHRDLTFYLRQPAPDATRLAIADYFIRMSNTAE